MKLLLATVIVSLIGCYQSDKKAQPVSIAGVYAMEVTSPYGITRDTIEVKLWNNTSDLYQVKHKLLFLKKSGGKYEIGVAKAQTHLATYEEHLGHLQDIHDGTLFRLYHSSENPEGNLGHYVRIQ